MSEILIPLFTQQRFLLNGIEHKGPNWSHIHNLPRFGEKSPQKWAEGKKDINISGNK